jgi:hypothetical protein
MEYSSAAANRANYCFYTSPQEEGVHLHELYSDVLLVAEQEEAVVEAVDAVVEAVDAVVEVVEAVPQQ